MLAALLMVSLLVVAVPQGAGAQSPAPKKQVNSAADLPVFTYPMSGTAAALVQSDPATFAAFAAKVRSDLDTTLATYDIEDHATLRGLLGLKLNLQVLSGTEDAAALETLEQIRALQDKPDAKLLTGLVTNAVIRARMQTGQSSGDAYTAAVGKIYRASIDALPYAVVGSRLEATKAGYEVISPNYLLGEIASDVEPSVQRNHSIGGDLVGAVVSVRYALLYTIPLKPQLVDALSAYIAHNTVVKPDIWAARDIALKAAASLTPVRVAIWDSGTDVSLFPHQLFTDPKPGPNDPHGIAFDLLGLHTHGALLPLTPEQRAEYPSYRDYLKGFSDLQVAINSPEATAVRQKIASLSPQQVATFFENIELFANYAHGTHVSGIAVRGNPAARIVVSRITFDYKNVPTAPSEELSRRAAADSQAYVDYFKAHGVRVVNMSWGGTVADDEEALEKNGIGKDAAERKAIAAKLFKIESDGLYNAIKSAPGILFICSAGNSDQSTTFSETIPASFKLPNIFAVGAVDQAGDETSFTSYGSTVLVDADGYEVVSTVPGGAKIPLSGTSMSSPEVVNLAAKLFALDPKLTPELVTALIRDGATPSADGKRRLLDPKRSVALLHQRYHTDVSAVIAAP